MKPSRGTRAELQAYSREGALAAERVNHRWGRGDGEPVRLDTADVYALTVAAMTRYDALLVNSVKDGLNLVAKEAAVVSERDLALVLSALAGAAGAGRTCNPTLTKSLHCRCWAECGNPRPFRRVEYAQFLQQYGEGPEINHDVM